MKRSFSMLFIFLTIALCPGCNKDEEPEPIAQKEIIKIGDTIDKVEQVYGAPDVRGNWYYEEAGQSISGYMWMYNDLDLTFLFDDSSPRKVIHIEGEQG